MDTLPLPPHPDVESYETCARALVAAASSPEPEAVRVWATELLGALARSLGVTLTPFVKASIARAVAEIEARVRAAAAARASFSLVDAQLLLARAHSFESWAAFAAHVAGARADGGGSEFEQAADAIVSGDLATLAALLRQRPTLVRARSARTHAATLLHYVAANGVEDWRQRTPPNAPAIARALLAAGAEVDALANTYGGGQDQTTMNLLVSSVHPASAGLQPALVEVLLDGGAAADGLGGDGSPLMTALAFGYLEAAETLARRGARVDCVLAAAALGRVELVRRFVLSQDRLGPEVSRMAPRWLGLPDDPRAHIALALVWACGFGRATVVELLLERGVDSLSHDKDGMTCLHWAAARTHLDTVKLLLRHGARLEVENQWGGTVLDSTMYFARQEAGDGAEYLHVTEALLAAGANVAAVTPFPTGKAALDEVLLRHGARPG